LVADDAVAILPAGQFIAVQEVAEPPNEYVPTPHAVQPSVAEVDPPMTELANSPAGHVMSVHPVTLPPLDYVPCPHTSQLIVADESPV
jgi:hypothetical protein